MKVKAILIDAEKQEIRDIELDAEESAYRGIVNGIRPGCLICTGWTWYKGDRPAAVLYVDDEGLINGTATSFWLRMPDNVGGLRCNPAGPNQPFMGNGVITGVDASGETVDAPFEAKDVTVAWPIL